MFCIGPKYYLWYSKCISKFTSFCVIFIRRFCFISSKQGHGYRHIYSIKNKMSTSSQISFLLELIQKENFISIFHSRGCNNGGDFVLYYGIPVRSFWMKSLTGFWCYPYCTISWGLHQITRARICPRQLLDWLHVRKAQGWEKGDVWAFRMGLLKWKGL